MAKQPAQRDGTPEAPPKKKHKSHRKSHINSSDHGVSESHRTVQAIENSAVDYTPSPALSALPQSEIDQFLESNSIKITDPSSGELSLRPLISFEHLPPCKSALYEPLKVFSAPTLIQATAWPLLFTGRDVIGIAETGSGKTLAFALPCLKKLANSKRAGRRISHPAAVIIAPTRELAIQTYDQIITFTNAVGIQAACVYGGVKKDEQRESLKAAAIVVATPGRLKDLHGEGSIGLGKVKYLVLDEADRMLDSGFEQDIKDIVSRMPVSGRQTIMFTATWPSHVRDLAATFTTSPVTITIGGDPSADPRANMKIKQVVEVLDSRNKETRLLQILENSRRGIASRDKVLVFCLYKKEAVRIERLLRSKGYQVAGIHGDLSQKDRLKSLEAFKTGTVPLLVATDVAARGLDIPAVKMVLNVTFPLTVEDYVHRIGRYVDLRKKFTRTRRLTI
jgi:ATP-dependent RNA helicase DBP3